MKPARFLLVLASAAFVLAAVLACSSTSDSAAEPGAPSGEIAVFAASSLTNAFNELGTAFESKYPATEVTYNFAGTSTLRTQLEQGAPADVFASANQSHMERAVANGVVDAGAPSNFASNRLVVITPARSSTVTSLADLAKDGVLLTLALPDVPVGGYSRQVLENLSGADGLPADYADMVLANLVSEESNVRQVVAKVALGEADAGIVYQTDVTAGVRDDVTSIDIPTEFNVVASYPIAPVAEASNATGASAFVEFVLSAEGQAILSSYGFGAPE